MLRMVASLAGGLGPLIGLLIPDPVAVSGQLDEWVGVRVRARTGMRR
jgi:hypothetical protein